MNLPIHPHGQLPQQWKEALAELEEDLSMTVSQSGIPVEGVEGDHLSVVSDGTSVTITWAEPVQFYRALSLIPFPLEPCNIQEKPCFKTVGIMFDVSRNAVLTPEAIRFFLRKMALMGLNLGMMYTEDTYEVPEQPYFGYKRGRYSMEELRQLDDYADRLGIELCPCIQTLGHLNRALHWPTLSHLQEDNEVIMPDIEETYEFLEQLIRAAIAPYRSKRIHIGMDEAHGLGLGKHYYRFGYEEPHKIMFRHLKRVLEITKKYDLDPIMWSDMYFALDGHDYHTEGDPSQSAIDAVAPGVTLMYWDYYQAKEEAYLETLRKHAMFPAPTVFAGGIWTWCGIAPSYETTITNTVAGLSACKKSGIPLVLATAWGDDGAETNFATALLGLQLYGEFTYKGEYDEANLRQRFARCCGADPQAFLDLSDFNHCEGMNSQPNDPANAVKIMLYQDPLVQLFEKDMEIFQLEAHYAELETRFNRYTEENPAFAWLFGFYAALAKVLKQKCHWHENAAKAVRNGDRAAAAELADAMPAAAESVDQLRGYWRRMWETTNKPQGFEVLEGRLGAVRARLLTAGEKMRAFANGEVDDIPELTEETLIYRRREDNSVGCTNFMGDIVSACKIDR